MLFVALTTIVLLMVTLFSAMDFPFGLIFYLTVIGQIMVIIMVYKVLTDNYSTNKTFEDFYEDRPIDE